MKTKIISMLCALALCLPLCACGEKDSDISMYELEKTMLAADAGLPDKADVPAAEDSLREHLEGRVRLYKTYEPEQMSRAESAVIKSDGSFVMLIMCDDPTAVENAFNEFLNTK